MKDWKHYVDLSFRMRKRKRNDIAWQYCTVVDDNVGRVCCNFCGHVMWGGVTRLKQHLACIEGNVIPCQCCPPEVRAHIQEYLSHSSQKNEENIDGGGKQVNDMRGGGNEEQLQPEQEYSQKFVSEIEENLPDCLQKNEANIDGVNEQVNDMRGEGNEEQLQPKQEWWQKSVGDDMFAYLCEAAFDFGWEARNLEYEMELKRKSNEHERAVDAVQRESELTFWEDQIQRGEGCSGTKPVPSYQESGMTGNDSVNNSELGSKP
ncbi:hypothetical protein NL676_034524 [Syzygium grande]|nr:hypothetical protein NL676_034524 [Syzygium grande]